MSTSSLRSCCTAALTVAMWLTSAASAQESWVGKQILTARDGIRISHTDEQGNQVDVAPLTEYRYVVLDDRDGWLQVKTYGVAIGWFEKKDAVPVDEAVEYFTERIRQNPDDWLAYNRRAGAWHYRGQLDLALPDYNETLRLNPNQVGMFNDRGMVWRKKNEVDKAIADFDQALRINSRNIVSYQNRADAWLAKGENDKIRRGSG